MKALNQTWEKDGKGTMVLLFEEEVEVPEPEPTLEERIKALEDKVKETDTL